MEVSPLCNRTTERAKKIKDRETSCENNKTEDIEGRGEYRCGKFNHWDPCEGFLIIPEELQMDGN